MTPAVEKLVEAARQAHEALRLSYNVTDYPADGDTTQDHAMRTLESAISAVGAEEREGKDGVR